MAVSNDLLEAKQALSTRLLGARAAVLPSATVAEFRVSVATANPGANVHAVGVGRKIVDGQTLDTRAVRLYVVQKLPESMLTAADRLPSSINGIPTDVIEAPQAFLNAPACTLNRRRRQRPVVGGISAGHVDITAGTIACFCRSTAPNDNPNDIFVLSNNHVFANVDAASIGDALLQPGPVDGGVAADRFADLHRFASIKLGGVTANKVDAAIGRLRPGTTFRRSICRIGNLTGTTLAVEDMLVRKHGRTTGYTEGIVTDESIDALVGMDHSDPTVIALFENQMRIERTAPFSVIGLGGDSGSLVVTRTGRRAVGLYFAGPDSGVYGLASHIDEVLNLLQITLI